MIPDQILKLLMLSIFLGELINLKKLREII